MAGISVLIRWANGSISTKCKPDLTNRNEGTNHRETLTATREDIPVKLLLLLTLFALTSPISSLNHAIVDVTVVDTQTGALTPHRTVVVRDGRIRSLDNVPPPKGTTFLPGRQISRPRPLGHGDASQLDTSKRTASARRQ